MVVGAAPILRDGRLVRARERKAARGGEPPGPRVCGVSQGRPRGPGLCFWRGSRGRCWPGRRRWQASPDLPADSPWPGVTATPALPVGVLCRGPRRCPPGQCPSGLRSVSGGTPVRAPRSVSGGAPVRAPSPVSVWRGSVRCLAGLLSVWPARWFTQGSMSAFWLRGPWTLGRSSQGCVVQGLQS